MRKIHGDEIAGVWEQIKQFGKTSFMDWQATGVSSFMQKEILTNKLRAFADFAMSNPMTAPLIDARELLNQTWDVMEIGRESPILEAEGEAEIPPQIQQKLQQLEEQLQQMGDALGKAGDEVDKLEASTEAETRANDIAKEGREVDRFKAETERLKLVLPFLSPLQLAEIAASIGLQAATTPDIATEETHIMPDGQEMPDSMMDYEQEGEMMPEMMQQPEQDAGVFPPEA